MKNHTEPSLIASPLTDDIVDMTDPMETALWKELLRDDVKTQVKLLVLAAQEITGLSQEKLALRAGISKVTMNHLATGRLKGTPRVEIVARIARAAGKRLELKFGD